MSIFDFFRKHSTTIFVVVAVTFIAGIFIGFGSYAVAGRGDIYAATVGGEKLLRSELEQQLGRTLSSLRERNPDEDISTDVEENLRARILQEMVQEELIWQEARRLGIKVTRQELTQAVTQMAAFKDKDGRFDRGIYLRTLAANRLTPVQFEKSVLRNIAQQKLFMLIGSGVKALPREKAAFIAHVRRELKPVKGEEPPTDEVLAGRFEYQRQNAAVELWISDLLRSAYRDGRVKLLTQPGARSR
jgi:parvulin-like peptidyl-prolyl isomerase